MTCDLCTRPATARDGDRLLCTPCYRAKYEVPATPSDLIGATR